MRYLLLAKKLHSLLLMFFVFLVICTADASGQTHLIVGYEENPPIAFTVSKTKSPTGMSVELLRHIAQQEGWNITWQPCQWGKCLEGLSSSQLDLLVGIGHTQEREALYSFATEPVLVNWGQLYAAKKQAITTMLDLEGKRIALVPTDLHGKVFSEMLIRFNIKHKIYQVQSYAEALHAVIEGKADACVISRVYPLTSTELKKIDQTPIIFNPIQNSYATLKGKHLDILHTIDRKLVLLRADKDSFYYKNLNRWLQGAVDRRVIPGWIWWFMAIGTVLFGAGLGWWRYRSMVTLNQQLSGLKQNLLTIFNNTDKGIIIHDLQGRILAVNRPALTLYGCTEEELLSLTVLDISAESMERHRQLPQMMAQIAAGGTMLMEWRCKNLADKSCFVAEIFYTGIIWNDEAVLMGMVQDVTEKKQRESLLRRLSIAVEQSANTIVITDHLGIIQYTNKSFERMTGYSEKEAVGKSPKILKSGVHSPEFYKTLWNKLLAGNTWQGDFCNKRKDGELFWESTTITPVREENENITHFVAIKEDVTQRRRDEETLYRQANYDELTGLPNRNLLVNRITKTIADENRCCDRVMLMFLDLNNFNTIISALGHSLADQLLKEIAERLVCSLKNEDMVARFGIKEFAIAPLHFCVDAREDSLAALLMESFSRPFNVHGQEIFVSASMGVAVYPEDGESAEALLRNAAAAMYQATKRGHNSFGRYNHEQNCKTSDRLELESRLRRALERNEFQVYYQPQQDMMSGHVVSLEALLRWQPSEGDPASPSEFIPILEETGLIIPVGEWVLREVCSQVVKWAKAGIEIRHASVNISFRQLQRPDIVERIIAIIVETGVDPTHICLELTESIMMEEPEEALQKLEALRAAGFSLSIDDFGTGYSSLAYLRKMPINELKIDRSFVMTLPGSNATLVNTILGMARSLGLRVVAEGVETESQRNFLKTNACEIMQGYLLSRPLPQEQFETFMNMSKINRSAAEIKIKGETECSTI